MGRRLSFKKIDFPFYSKIYTHITDIYDTIEPSIATRSSIPSYETEIANRSVIPEYTIKRILTEPTITDFTENIEKFYKLVE